MEVSQHVDQRTNAEEHRSGEEETSRRRLCAFVEEEDASRDEQYPRDKVIEIMSDLIAAPDFTMPLAPGREPMRVHAVRSR